MVKKSFNERCYDLLKKVPSGKVTTYKELALALDSRAYRAVGNAMNKNPFAPRVPCHRVVGASGDLTGYAYGLPVKKKLLISEGVSVINNKVNLSKFLYKF